MWHHWTPVSQGQIHVASRPPLDAFHPELCGKSALLCLQPGVGGSSSLLILQQMKGSEGRATICRPLKYGHTVLGVPPQARPLPYMGDGCKHGGGREGQRKCIKQNQILLGVGATSGTRGRAAATEVKDINHGRAFLLVRMWFSFIG
jgi:hypothetical protein